MLTASRSVVAIALAVASAAMANQSPLPPVINEPLVDGLIVNPFDVHMETGPMNDPDPGDMHLCSDLEIWTLAPTLRVWSSSCIGGLEKVHSHLGDGVFEGTHAGRTELMFDTDYVFRVRHRDDSGDPATEWSPWSERLFRTGPPTQIFALETSDVSDSVSPQWRISASAASVLLPPASPQPSLRLEGDGGELLLEIRGDNGSSNTLTNPPELAGHVHVRIVVSPGGLAGGLLLPETDLTFVDDDGDTREVFLPGANVAPGETLVLWISENGSTYYGDVSQTEPDFSLLARGAPVPWVPRQPGYVVEVVAKGFKLPVNIAFVPNPGTLADDPYYYVTELYGTIKVVTRDGTVSDYVSGLLNYVPSGNFPGTGEQGLTGLAVDPATGDVFAGMLYNVGGPTNYPKLLRFSSTDGGHTASSQTTLLDMVGEPQGQSHQISNLTIGPDGKLYLHMGDGFDFTTAQNLGSFRGKILRINPDGSASSDNPFYNAGDGITARDYVYAYGLRNPFGGAWREADGQHYEVENGPGRDRFAKIVPGRNYLWDGNDASMNNYALYVWSPATGPVNLAWIQPGTFAGSGFPSDKMDHAFVTESGPTYATGPNSRGKRITEFVLDAGGNLISGPATFVEYTGSGKATAVGLAAGPDGLYFSDLYKDLDYASPTDLGANILRVRFVGSADFTADYTSGASPLTVQFTDLSNVVAPTAWSWDFGDNGTSAQQHPVHTYTQDGVYDVTLEVTHSNGIGVAEKHAYIVVGEVPQIALIGVQIPPTSSDSAVADFVESLGLPVDVFDDEPANRPSAAQLAADYDLVIVSSTVTSSNVAAEFRNQPVPLIYWEQALNRTDREPLAGNGITLAGQTAIEAIDRTHPVTAALPAGTLQVMNLPSNMSVAFESFGPDVDVLATPVGEPSQAAIMVADAGAELLGGHHAPDRRVFLFLEDSSFLTATATARQIFEQAVYWALDRAIVTVAPDFDHDRDVDQTDFGIWQACLTGPGLGPPVAGCEIADFDGDSDVDQSDFGYYQRCVSGSNVIAEIGCDQ